MPLISGPPYAVPNVFIPDTIADANAVNANFTYVDNALNQIAGTPAVNSLNGKSGTLSLTSTGNTVQITVNPTTIDLETSSNVGFFISTMATTASASANLTALQNDINAINTAGGGTYVLPNGTVQINGSVTLGNQTYLPIHITSLTGKSNVQQTTNSDVFILNLNPGNNGDLPGMLIDNFSISYTSGATSGAGIRVIGGAPGAKGVQHLRIDQMTFIDCPCAIAADNTLQLSITRCLSQQNNVTPNPATITMGTSASSSQAIELHLSDSLFRSSSTANVSSNPGGIGMLVQGIENLHMWDCRFEGYDGGLFFKINNGTGSVNHKIRLEGVYVETATGSTGAANGLGPAFLFQPAKGFNVPIIELERFGCCPGDQYNTNMYTGAGIVFDASNGTSGASGDVVLDMIKLISCWSFNWNGPGLEFITANLGSGESVIQNVEIIGGSYVCNGLTSTSGNGSGAGIFFNANGNLGVMSRIRVLGVMLSNTSIERHTSNTQQYGLAVSGGGITGMFVEDCDFGGTVNLHGPLFTSGVANGLKLYNNALYNDLNTLVTSATTNLTAGAQFDATTAGATPYYGPYIMYSSGGSVTSIALAHERGPAGANLPVTALTGMSLNPGQSMQFNGALPSAFWMYGQ